MDMWAFVIFGAIAAIVISIGIFRAVKTPEKKVRAKVIRKGDFVNTERNSWFQMVGPRRRRAFGVNINLRRIVVFQDTEAGAEIEIEVSKSKYDILKVGQTGVLYHRFGVLRKFEVEGAGD